MMETSASSNQSKQLFCSLRKEWVTALPEEEVRQKLVVKMLQELGFPSSYLVVEKSLRHMPHLMHKKKLPERRADLICFSTDLHHDFALYPLLLVECKAVPLTEETVKQVVGYNYYLGAPFIALANQHEVRTGWLEAGTYRFIPFIPSYLQLLEAAKKSRSQ